VWCCYRAITAFYYVVGLNVVQAGNVLDCGLAFLGMPQGVLNDLPVSFAPRHVLVFSDVAIEQPTLLLLSI